MIKLCKIGKNKYTFNKEIFLLENDLSFYLLGAYMTDGNINDKKHHISFSLSSIDEDWLINIRNIISPEKPIYQDKERKCYTLATSNIDVINWLISYGCTPNKSKTLKIEKEIPDEYKRDFIRGVLDGDGSISFSPYKKIKNGKEYNYMKTHSYICSASKTFLESIKMMIPIEINCNINLIKQNNSFIRGKEVKATCDHYRLTFNDSYAKKLFAWIYYPNNKLSLMRKEKLANNILNCSRGRI